MFYLLIVVLSTVAFMQTLRYGQRREVHLYSAVAVNYLIAFATVLLLSGLLHANGDARLPWHAIIAGAATGVLFFGHVPIILGCFRKAGVAVTTAIGGCSPIVPVVVGWAVWEEAMTTHRWIALAIVPIAMWLLRPGNVGRFQLTLATDLLLLANFAGGGVIYTMQKYADVHFELEKQEVYKVSLFGMAAVISILFAVITKVPLKRRDLGVGIMLGLLNATTLTFTLLGLGLVASVVFYPTATCLMVCLNVTMARLLWHEQLKPRQLAGVALALAVIALTNVTG